MPQTLVEKIAQAHVAGNAPARPVRAGDFVSLRPDHVMTHDNTAAVMKKFAGLGAAKLHDPRQPVFALDHDVQNRTPGNIDKYAAIAAFAKDHGVDFYPAGSGIGHQLIVENGYATPGALVVASDSHSNMYGGVGTLGTPVVRTDAAAIWATGVFWWQIPHTVRVELTGSLRPGVTGKDVILLLTGALPSEVLNAAVEFGGPAVASLSIDARLSIANMTTEWGALTGWFPVDDVTLDFFATRREVLHRHGIHRFAADDLEAWRADPTAPDANAPYAAHIELDLSGVTPHVAGPDTVQAARPLAEVAAEKISIDKAYLVSCVNSRLEDLRAAAAVLRGKKVHEGVSLYVGAASAQVQAAAEADGTWQTLMATGAVALPAACGPCIGLGNGLLGPGEVGISATNRNFKGRMGSRDARCYLGSPEIVAASAIAGTLCGPAQWSAQTAIPVYRSVSPIVDGDQEAVPIVAGFPREISGRLVFVDADNLNTDGMYGKDYTYREDMTPQKMAAVAMENYDPEFAARVVAGDILVGGYNFGTGSSREQAVTAVQHKGIPLVIAATFSQTYLRNAFNNGVLCVACPMFVDRLRQHLGNDVGAPTLIPGDTLWIRFDLSVIVWNDEEFGFSPLSEVPQALVVKGGIENLVREQLGVATQGD